MPKGAGRQRTWKAVEAIARCARLKEAVVWINARFGRRTAGLAGAGLAKRWAMRSEIGPRHIRRDGKSCHWFGRLLLPL
ncbi:DUF4113 domain-containing protein [uncultured Nevskia sp.]|uniref:DUF4113 domain-containing protein n=1 Tax=uncultured Nevskia sp. TaxID=228950 RepID=UPI00345D2E52